MSSANQLICTACGAAMRDGRTSWLLQCVQCGYEASLLSAAINQTDLHQQINETTRERGLKPLRQRNFRRLITAIKSRLTPQQNSLLDVGSAHGWFLEEAASSFDICGIEADIRVGEKARDKGLPVRLGYFPDVLMPDEKFDVIVFNDVIEHIPDIDNVVQTCAARLNANGLLVLNVPNSAGIFYRLAKLLALFGWVEPLERLWQKGLPSPHLHYFAKGNLDRLLVNKHGFEMAAHMSLSSIELRGLWERMRCVENQNVIKLIFVYMALVVAIPALSFFEKDIMVGLYRKK
jgi:2-polyprenyl-3-methyl-5-hydroxy-6-metoxy-1,4-benzoquinol methylase